ncbi:indolepyruvate ferredoxin oxidoreductase subunit alpha [Paenibacillus sp. FSL R5-0912]|uniref:indolepyruvate ferredoxin oxidoreductase subunit alpha n=1 Tax=Paenibacillus sp. FSL R5-0912 TaxID=1536771 RepID=UPI0004F6A4B4|nr:indolepyruvate ferredoxin oxidoreductase subunit alpha [Paenibacillus sp. FSL R5-0912]AIQ41733.1 indolepyruvate ferredoxin oxidoreductase [Paenibacillus sp. FSL R5-0912]
MKALMMGNEAIARGAYEANCKIISSYPGTPSTEIVESISVYEGVYAEWAPNEKVALEVAAGACIAGIRSLTTMKHVGVNVAADPLFNMTYEGVNAGLVIVSADDPGIHSSQNEQDNRIYASHAKMPLLEPTSSQECKDMIVEAYEISERFNTPVLFRTTTRVSHSKGIVHFREDLAVEEKFRTYKKNKLDRLLLPAISRKRHLEIEANLLDIQAYSNASPLNVIEYSSPEIGIVTSGISYQYVKEVFGDTVSVLKLGMSYPFPNEKAREFAAWAKTIYVVEEGEPFIETSLKTMGIACTGKEIIPVCGELNPEIIRKAITREEFDCYEGVQVPPRPPRLCAGCGYLGLYSAVKQHRDIIAAGDIGCYTLGGTEPIKALDTVLCMGASISMATGMQRTQDFKPMGKKVFAFIGDSTFFHSGMTGLLNAVYNKTPIVICILDNRSTSMTGNQENPGTGRTLQGNTSEAIRIEDIVLALGIKPDNLRILDPTNLQETQQCVETAKLSTEPFVIISRHPCELLKSKAEPTKKYIINNVTCVNCKKCTMLGCSAIKIVNRQIMIDPLDCKGCSICQQVCPYDSIKEA